jgi:TctA family transporter
LLAAILVRLGLLLGTSPSGWAMALVASSIAGKLAWLVATRAPRDLPLDDESEVEPVAAGLTPPRWGVVGLIAICGVVAFTGPWGVGLLVAATAMGWGARRLGISRATLVGVVELAAMIAIAIAVPATVSPLVSR